MRTYLPILTLVLLIIFLSVLWFGFVSDKIVSESVQRATAIDSILKGVLFSSSYKGPEVFKRKDEVKVVFVGDIMLDRGVKFHIERGGHDYKFPFLEVADRLNDADVVFGNLEGPVSDKGRDVGGLYSFRFDPRVVEGLNFAGFDVVSIANNHIWDWGRDALVDTVSILESGGIVAVGAGKDEERANKPAIIEVNGINLGFLAYITLYPEGLIARGDNPGVSNPDPENIILAVKNLREKVDVVIVSMHWGEEYQTRSNANQRELGRKIIDAGADLVIGHHPHVSQEVERYKDGWIVYSLGNFVFDQGFSEETMKGLVVEAMVRGGKVKNLNLYETKLNNYFQPFFK